MLLGTPTLDSGPGNGGRQRKAGRQDPRGAALRGATPALTTRVVSVHLGAVRLTMAFTQIQSCSHNGTRLEVPSYLYCLRRRTQQGANAPDTRSGRASPAHSPATHPTRTQPPSQSQTRPVTAPQGSDVGKLKNHAATLHHELDGTSTTWVQSPDGSLLARSRQLTRPGVSIGSFASQLAGFPPSALKRETGARPWGGAKAAPPVTPMTMGDAALSRANDLSHRTQVSA